jgi:hypothetical protein
MHGVLAGFPFGAQAAHGLAQTNRRHNDSFEALRRALRQAAVAFAAYFGEQKFGINQDTGEWVIQFVP